MKTLFSVVTVMGWICSSAGVLFGTMNMAHAAPHVTTLDCHEDHGRGSRIVLQFVGYNLTRATISNHGINGFPKQIEFDRQNSTFKVASNVSTAYRVIRQDTHYLYPGSEALLSYKIMEDGRPLSLMESLVGPQYYSGRAPYGKLRFDFAVNGALGKKLGFTEFFLCSIAKVER